MFGGADAERSRDTSARSTPGLGDKFAGDEVLEFGSRYPGIHAGRCSVGAVIQDFFLAEHGQGDALSPINS